MKKKLFKYIKTLLAITLIGSLTLPSYAAVNAADGSAFATKAEFDSALSDFNARLTTFEAGINSKIDSQVSSYLDRNGIWNGKSQTLTSGWAIGVKHNLFRLGNQKELSELSPKDSGLMFGYELITNVDKTGLIYISFQLDWDSEAPKSYRLYTSEYSSGVQITNYIATAFQSGYLEIGTYDSSTTTINKHPKVLGYSGLYIDAQERFSQSSTVAKSFRSAEEWGTVKFGLIPTGHMSPLSGVTTFMVSKNDKVGLITYVVGNTGSTFSMASPWVCDGGTSAGTYWTMRIDECKVY